MSTRQIFRPLLGLAVLIPALIAGCGDNESGAEATIAVYVGAHVSFDTEDAMSQGANLLAAVEFTGEGVETFTEFTAEGLADALEGKTHLVIPSFTENGWDYLPEVGEVLQAWVAAGGVLVLSRPTTSQINGFNTTFGFELAAGDNITETGYVLERTVAQWAGTPVELPTSAEIKLLEHTTLPDNSWILYGGVEGLIGIGAAYMPHGVGSVFYLGWDWQDMGGGTPETCPWGAVLAAIIAGTEWAVAEEAMVHQSIP